MAAVTTREIGVARGELHAVLELLQQRLTRGLGGASECGHLELAEHAELVEDDRVSPPVSGVQASAPVRVPLPAQPVADTPEAEGPGTCVSEPSAAGARELQDVLVAV